ncbi:MAG: diguanylate cyclase [Nitrospirae bacterium]|nr:diguanylate cyclase [Nitrospirota bacterium]
MIRVALVGAGKAGSAMLGLFQTNVVVKTVGITDSDRNAPGLAVARTLGVFVAGSTAELYAQKPDIIINVTGNPDLSRDLLASAPAGTEVMDGNGARLLLGMVQRQKSAKKEMETLYQNGLSLLSAKSLNEVLSATLEKAMELTDTPAGSIALCERNEMVMAVSRGLSSFQDVSRWKLRPNGLTSYVLAQKKPVEIADVREYTAFDTSSLTREGILSIFAFPLMINGDIVGILFLDAFSPRTFSDTHRNLIRLFGVQAAQAIDKFRILEELYNVITDLDGATAYLKNVLDDSQDMIMTTDTDGKIVEYSQGGERILGYTRDEIIGMQASDFYLDKNERARVLDILGSKGAVFNYETQLVKKDGSAVDISLTISQLTNKTGKIIGTVGISKDITEEKRLRNELSEKNEELVDLNIRLEDKVIERTRELEKINRELSKANQMKARFISNMSHELRTPLNSILGFSEILMEKTFGDLNEKQQRHVSNIFASGKHLLALVNNILDLAKIEAGKIDLFYEDFSVKDAVDEVAMIMHSLASKKSLQVGFDMSEDVTFFRADKVKFKQILYNLISNAIKFTPEGGSMGIRASHVINRGSAIPWAMEGQNLLRVSVWDKGMGIREDDKDRIFEEFEQADSSMARDYEGTGLGLALTKRLVDLHGGQISVQSTYGEGSEFVFYLPSVSSEMKKEEALPLDSAAVEFPWLKEESPLVLVVEDDRPTSEILTIHLSKAGYRVVHAYDGVEAIAKAKEMKPFVITLDVMLPKKDGWEVLQSLKADPETNSIPVIMHSIIDNKDLAYTLGASDYLLKPVDKNILLAKLGELSLFNRKNRQPISLLLISDDKNTLDYICNIADTSGFLFHAAPGKEEGIELALGIKPNIIMIDMSTCGFDFIKKLKNNIATMGIPIFALTGKDLSIEERLNMTGQIERILQKDAIIATDLIMHLKDLEILHPKRAGLIDDLTGLFSHRYFQLRLAQEVNRALRYKMPLTLILLDIDNFSNYVKQKGDHHGNLVLKKIAELLKRNIRGSDVVIRYGGDAFSVILPNTPLSPGVTLGKRFNTIISDYPFLHEEVQPKGKLTVSVGIVGFNDQSPEELIKCSEIALAAAVSKGGNSVEVFEPLE